VPGTTGKRQRPAKTSTNANHGDHGDQTARKSALRAACVLSHLSYSGGSKEAIVSGPKAIAKPAAAPRAANARGARPTTGGAAGQAQAGPRQTVAVADAQIYRLDPQARIALIRQGIPASMIGNLSSRMGMSKESLLSSLGLSRATISRKEKGAATLSRDESERVLGVETLIGIVQTMVEQSGNPAGFDAARWVADWLTKPLPALAGATPASYMDTFEGQKLVAELLSMSQSGAYA
jgi:uncharacterized protein (DUF2384 family)